MDIKEKLKTLRGQLETLDTSIKAIEDKYPEPDKTWAEEDVKSYQKAVGEMQGIARQIDVINMRSDLEAWKNEPDGQSAVKDGFGRRAIPGEGVIEGITKDRAGELYATSTIGEEKLAALKSGAYKDALNDYIRSMGGGRRPMKAESVKVLQSGIDTQGGFWISPDARPELIKKVAAMTTIRPNATVTTTGKDQVTWPKVTYSADNKYTSGVRLTWTSAPVSSLTEATNPVAGVSKIDINLATAGIIVTRDQLDDNDFDLLGFITQLGMEAFGLGEEDAYLNGDGAGKPKGLITGFTDAWTDFTKAASGGSASLTWGTSVSGGAGVGILGLESKLPAQYDARAKWLFNKATKNVIAGLVDTTGRALWNQEQQYPNFAAGYPPTLLGKPVMVSEFMPDIAANAYPILFGDFSGYFIVDRVGLSVEVYRETYADMDKVLIYMRKRVGGDALYPWQIKAMKVAATV